MHVSCWCSTLAELVFIVEFVCSIGFSLLAFVHAHSMTSRFTLQPCIASNFHFQRIGLFKKHALVQRKLRLFVSCF